MPVGERVLGRCRRAGSRLRAVGAGWSVLVVPVLFTLGLVRARPRRLYETVDGGLVAGIVHNLRCCASLTSPTDQYWVRLDPVATYHDLPRLRVADLGPLHPLLVAMMPASLDRSMWLVNALAGAAVLVLLAVLVRRATGSWAAGVAAEALLVLGPTQHTVFGSVTWSNLVGTTVYDVTAVACLLGAVVASLGHTRTARWTVAVLWVAACLTKPSFLVVLGIVAVWRGIEVARRRRAHGDVAPLAVATAAVTVWQGVVAPLWSGSSTKSLAWHPIRDMGFFEAVLGWVRLDGVVRASHAAGLVLGLVVLAGLGVLAVRRSADEVLPLLALVAIADVTSVVVGRFVFDAEVVLRDERQLLLSRVCVVALVVVGLHCVVSRVMLRGGSSPLARGAAGGAPWVAGLVTLVAVLLASVAIGTRPWFVPVPERVAPPLVVDQLASHPEAVVMSNAPTTLYRQTGLSVLTMLQPREPTTLRPVDVAGQLTALAQAMRADGRSTVLDVVYDDFYLAVIDPMWFECASLVAEQGAPGVDVSLVDIAACADPAAVVPVPGSPIAAP